MLTLAELTNFLQNAHWPQIPERRPTFFSIAGFPHYENVMSNVYQFFFSTESPHGLGSLCVDALLEVVGEAKKRNGQPWQPPTLRRINVEREVSTGNGRLDLLLHDGLEQGQWKDASAVVLIENKVYHWLANDLEDYWQFVTPDNQQCQKLGIVLGLNREDIPLKWQDDWIAVTHLEWAQTVEKRLGPILYRAEPRYVSLLLELIENIRAMTNSAESFNETMLFVQQNQRAIQKVEEIRRSLFLQIPDAIREALQKFDIYSPKFAKNEGWLTAKPVGDVPLLYIVSYYGIVYPEQDKHSFTITLSTANNAKPDYWQQAFETKPEVQQLGIKQRREEGSNYILCKEYFFTPDNYHRFAHLVAEKLRSDWQPLEIYWLNHTENSGEPANTVAALRPGF